VRRTDNLTTFICRLSRNLGASTSWNSQGLSRPVMGLFTFTYNHMNTKQNPAGNILHRAVFYTIASEECTDTTFKAEETTWSKSTSFTQTLITAYESTGCHAWDDRNFRHLQPCEFHILHKINPLNPELNPICYLMALLGAHHFLHVSRIRVKSLTFRLLMSYIYGAPVLDVSRSHTTTQHSR